MRFNLSWPALALAFACSAPPAPSVPAARPVTIDFDDAGAVVGPGAFAGAFIGASATAPFFAGATYNTDIPAPPTCLHGQAIGATMARSEDIIACFRAWAEASPRAQVERYALSHEGRELVRVVISSPQNLARLDDIRARIGKLADPRGLADADAASIIADTPAIAWFGYSVHGDEVSGADASMAFGYHLIAATDDSVKELLERVVVVIDPVMNPDGRTRIISQIEQSASLVPSLNHTSMHRGRWPWGRGNHYLFDMNRDWLVGATPETRGRWREIQRFNPQLLIDAHEMSAQETYLFYPHAEPINRHFPATLGKWQEAFAADHARAFDAYGWAYYTREWADGWYPGYSDAWGSLSGAIGILYEQASTKGQPLMRTSGRVVTYRETVHAQTVSSMSNLMTLARNREPVLRDYLAFKRRWVTPSAKQRTFALRPGRAPDRERYLLTTLMRQGVEVYRADADFQARGAETALAETRPSEALPRGTYLIPMTQPHGSLVAAALGFDARLSDKFLAEERAELERKGTSKLYDVTAWNLGQAFALDCYWIDNPRVAMTQVTEAPSAPAGVTGADPEHAYAWVIDGRDDASVAFAVLGLERGLIMHVSEKAFTAAGQSFPRGSLVVRRGANPAKAGQEVGQGVGQLVDELARAVGVRALAVRTGRSHTDGPDLGAYHFQLVHRPRIAVLANWPVEPSSFGHVWYQLDQQIRAPVTMLDIQSLGSYDLRRYNVIVIPPADSALAAVLQPHAEAMAAWVRGGGTLIALGSSSTVLADAKLGLSKTRLMRDVLEQLPLYKAAAERELDARTDKAEDIDGDALWRRDGDNTPSRGARDSTTTTATGKNAGAGKETGKPGDSDSAPKDKDAVQAEDAWMRRFAPQGVMLRGLVDPNAWLTLGYEGDVPVFVEGAHALMAKAPVATPIRLARADSLRISGLLWPEARARLATSAYATVEPVGDGQIILFASAPAHRAHFLGTARLLANAMVYGPSLGASQPAVW